MPLGAISSSLMGDFMKKIILFSILAFAFSAKAAGATLVSCGDFNDGNHIQVSLEGSGEIREGSGELMDNYNGAQLVCHQRNQSKITCVGLWHDAFDVAGKAIDKTVLIDIELNSSFAPPAIAKYLRDWDGRVAQKPESKSLACAIQ